MDSVGSNFLLEGSSEAYSIYTKHRTLSFSAGHFICQEEDREFLHGHTYRVGLFLQASKVDQKTGFIFDYRDVESPLKEILEPFKGRLIVPTLCPSLQITDDGTSVTMVHGKSKFVIPKEDCNMVDIKHSSCEELAKWLTLKLVEKVGKQKLIDHNIKSLRLDVYEIEERFASYYYKLE